MNAINGRQGAPNAHIAMWVVYDHPSDYPHSYVARQWIVRRDTFGSVLLESTQTHIIASDMEQLRGALPQGLVRLERDSNDDPCIVESWI